MEGEEKLIQEIRAIVISSKGGTSLGDLRRDFFDLNGSDDMYKSLGFRTLDEFVYSRPKEFRVRNGNVFAAEKEESSHIQRLVNQQNGKVGKRTRLVNVCHLRGLEAKEHMCRNMFPRYSSSKLDASRNVIDTVPTTTVRRPSGRGGYAPKYAQPNPVRNAVPPRFRPTYQSQPPPDDRTRSKAFNGNNDSAQRNRQIDEQRTVIKEDENLVVKRIWPKEIFVNDDKQQGPVHNGTRNDQFPINGNKDELTRQGAQPRTFKAKEPRTRTPYRHNANNSPDYDDDDGEIFKVVPPLDDSNKIVKNTMPAKTSPTAVETTSTIVESQLKPLMSALTFSNEQSKNSYNPISSTESHSKNPVASRLARLQAQTQGRLVEDKASASKDIYDRLLQLCDRQGLPTPEYKVLSKIQDNEKVFSCFIRVGDTVIYGDVPTTDVNTALNLVVSKAFMALSSEKTSSVSKPVVNNAETTLFLKRLREMMENKPSGLWLSRLAETYMERYKSELPSGWHGLIAECPDFSINAALGQEILHLRVSPVESPQTSSVEAVAEKTNAVPYNNPGVPRNSKAALLARTAKAPLPVAPVSTPIKEMRRLPALEVPDSRYWDLYILAAKKPGELVGRIIGKEWSDKVDETLASLELGMMENKTQVTSPVVGEFYAVSIADTWPRARLEKILPNQKVEVYYLDDGENEVVDLDQIYVLDDKYLDVAPQALRLSLNGLERFPDVPHLARAMDQLLRRICVCEVMKVFPEQLDGVRACVVLWDTSTAEDINVNSLLMEQVVATLQGPSLSVGTTKEMTISYIGEDIYLQPADKSLQCIICLIEYIIACHQLGSYSVSKIVFNKTYLAKNPRTGAYQRAKVVEADSDTITVTFMDYGNIANVEMADLCDVGAVCKAIAIAPAQAVQVSLSGVGILSPAKLAVIQSSLLPSELVVVKVVGQGEGIPSVELFRRSPLNNALECLNTLLKAFDGEEGGVEPLRIPPLPQKGQLLCVNVTLSASPSVFTVQLMGYHDKIQELMYDLQASELSSAPVPNFSDLKENGLYAVLHASNWYRGMLAAIISEELLSVELCDFGNLVFPSLENIRQLPAQFHTIPRQALRATIAGIVPVNGDWSPSDCVFFQELVLEKELAAYLYGINYEADGPVLELRLIDTSNPDRDVDIANLLVERGVAVLVN